MTNKRVLGMGFHLCEFGIESLTEGLNNKTNEKHWELNAININNSSNKTNGKTTKSFKDEDTEKCKTFDKLTESLSMG